MASWQWAVLQTYGRCVSLSSALSSVVDGQLAAGRTADVRPLCQPVVSVVVCRRWPVGSGPYCRRTAATVSASSPLTFGPTSSRPATRLAAAGRAENTPLTCLMTSPRTTRPQSRQLTRPGMYLCSLQCQK